MTDKPYLSRFSQLEIPEDRKHLDWTFVEARLSLPRPIPLEDQPLLVLVNGRALAPQEGRPEAHRSLLFYGEPHALVELDPPGVQQAAYLKRHADALRREARRFFDSIPPAILDSPTLVHEARELLLASGPCEAGGALPGRDKALAATAAGHLGPLDEECLLSRRLVGHSRIMRIHHKLYDLLTLREYVDIFRKAVEPDCFRRLQQLPDTAPPEAMLQLIDQSLDAIHARARSPLRNKLETCRVVFNGVTLLPIYQEEAQGLLDSHAALLEQRIKLEALGDR